MMSEALSRFVSWLGEVGGDVRQVLAWRSRYRVDDAAC